MTRAGLYARVSSHDQQTLPLQIDAMRQLVFQRGWIVVTEAADVAPGWRERPQREELLRAARRGAVDVVIVWKLDRWGRSVPDLVGSLQELQQLHVGFVSITEALDLTTPSGRAMAGMLAVFAEFENEIRAERIRAGIGEARRKGTRLGRPPMSRTKSEIVVEYAARGMSKRAIAGLLGISRASIRRILVTIGAGCQ